MFDCLESKSSGSILKMFVRSNNTPVNLVTASLVSYLNQELLLYVMDFLKKVYHEQGFSNQINDIFEEPYLEQEILTKAIDFLRNHTLSKDL